MVAVGDEQRVEAVGASAGVAQGPDAVLSALGVLDGGLEADPLTQAEVVDVVVEVLGDVAVVGEVRIGLRHRVVRCTPSARGRC